MSDLNAILDAALDQFDEPAVNRAPTTNAAPVTTASPPPAAAVESPAPVSAAAPDAAAPPAAGPDAASIAAFEAFLQAMSSPAAVAGGADGSDPSGAGDLASMKREMDQMLQTMSGMSVQPNAAGGGAAAASDASAAANSAATPAAASASADPIADALRMISDGARSMPAGAAPAAGFDDANMEAMFAKLMADMGGAGGLGADGSAGSDASLDAMVEQMMGSMLSKDHLYEPMKAIAAKYPEYIREHESTLTALELTNYRAQQSCFERIVSLFELDPPPTMRIMEAMNEMQQYGTPPKDIVGDFTGFDPAQSMPGGMPGMGVPGMPGMPGLAGMPGLPGGFPGFPGMSGGAAAGEPTAAEMEAFKKMSDEACKMQ